MDRQIVKEHFMPLTYFQSQPFTGSLSGMRYMVRKGKSALAAGHDEETPADILEAFIWREPFSFDHTPDSQKIRKEFAFSADGIADAVDWINERRRQWEK